jgi:branched-chain amino acid aminotransferase
VLFYSDGEFVEEQDVSVPIMDYGFLYGDAVYESLAVAEGVLLDLDERVERFFNSARLLRLVMPVSREELRALLLEAASRNNFQDGSVGAIRPHLSRGPGIMGVLQGNRGEGVLRIIVQSAPFNGYREPIPVVDAILSSYERTTNATIDPRVKFSCYSASIIANFEAHDRNAKWAIFRNRDGYVREAAGGNVFVYRRGALWTPPMTEALDGITHRRLIDVARAEGYEVHETNITRYDLECADELFICSTAICIDAIGAIDGVPLPDPAPGPVTTALRDAYVRDVMAAGTPVPARAAV